MGVTLQVDRAAAGVRVTANASEHELMQEVGRLARSAEGVFATRAELRDWLTCMLHKRAHGVVGRVGGMRCNEVTAAACALTFGGECPLASSLSGLGEVMSHLQTERLQALLTLEQDAQRIWLSC